MAAVFRSLATMEGTLIRLAPGFGIVAETRRFASNYQAERLRSGSLRATVTDEMTTVLPMLRRLPRRIGRIRHHWKPGASESTCACSPMIRRRYLTGLVHNPSFFSGRYQRYHGGPDARSVRGGRT